MTSSSTSSRWKTSRPRACWRRRYRSCCAAAARYPASPSGTLRVAVCAGESLEVTLDGEIAGTLPGSFDVAGNALRVITPLSFVDKDDHIAEGRTK